MPAFYQMLRELPTAGGVAPRVTYVIGNQDRILHNFPCLQAQAQAAFGGVKLTFASHFRSDAYSVLARHGHEWDDGCHGWDFLRKVLRRGSAVNRFDPAAHRTLTIGEVITAELVSGLLHRLRAQLDLGEEEDRDFYLGFQDINHLRPFTAVFDWIAWFARGHDRQFGKYLEPLRLALRDSLEAVLETELTKRWGQMKSVSLSSAGDVIDHLSRACLLVKAPAGLRLMEGLQAMTDGARSAGQPAGTGSNPDALVEGARKEFEAEAAAGRSPQFILYGHTHEARQECFAGNQEGRVRLYVNTGTFQPFIERARSNRGFWTAHRMTFGMVFRDDEDAGGREGPGPTLDLWNGLRRKRYRACS